MTAALPDAGPITYVGERRDGAAVTGSLPPGADLAAWAEQRHRRGCRWLTASRAGETAYLTGAQ